MKKVLLNALVVGVLFLAAILIELSGNEPKELKSALIFAGIVYAAVGFWILFVAPLYRKIRLRIDSAIDEKVRTRAYAEILRLKALLEKDIISQEEFDSRSHKLKAKIL